MMKKKVERIFVCCFTLLLSVFFAISPATSAEPVVKEWKVPFLAFLTGPYAGFGVQIKWAADEAVKEVNAAGGIAGRPIVLEYHDTASDPAKAAAEMSKVVGELLIFGPISAQETKGAMPLVVREKGFAMAVWCGPDVNLLFHPYTMHLSPRFEDIITPNLQGWAKRNPGMKTVVQFVFTLDPTFVDVAKHQAKALEAVGVKTLPDVELSEGVDVASVVIRAMAQKSDGFTLTMLPVEAGKIVKELDKRGVKDKSRIIGFPVIDNPPLYEIGKGCLDGLHLWNFTNMLSKEPRWQALYKKFREAFPEFTYPDMGIPNAYDLVYMVKDAIEKNGITGDPAKRVEERNKIRDYCRNVKGFPGVQYRFNMVDGIAMTPVFLFKIKGNEKTLVEMYPPLK